MGTGPLSDSREGRINLPTGGVAVAIAGLLVAETLLLLSAATAGSYVGYALGVHLAVFGYCTLAPLTRDDDTGAFVALALLSVFRLVALGVPPVFDVAIYQLLLTYLPMVPAVLVATRLSAMPPLRSGLRETLPVMPVAAVAAVVLGVVEFAILDPSLLIPRPSPYWLFVATLALVGVFAPVEELLFRGLLQTALADRLGTPSGVLMSSVLFGVMHSQYGSLVEVGFGVVAGVVLGVLYVRSESLVLVSAVHGVANVLVFVVLPGWGT